MNDWAWQIVVCSPSRVEPEDIPKEMSRAIPGIGFLTEMSVEPIHAPKSALAIATRTARAIARVAHGVIVDQQNSTVSTPAGVSRFKPTRRPDRFSLIEMTWWFTDGSLNNSRDGVDAFVACLRSICLKRSQRGMDSMDSMNLHSTGYRRPDLSTFANFLLSTRTILWFGIRTGPS